MLISRYNELINESFGNDTEKLQIARDGLDLLLHMGISLEGALSWFDAVAFSDYKQCEGDQMTHWKGRGYATILKILMKKYPHSSEQLPVEEKIHLNSEVVKIVWDNNTLNPGGVTVMCADKSVYYADHAILTTSLGVLKENYRSLFSPALPQTKKTAIEDIGYGAVLKIFLHFPDAWWANTDYIGMNFIWSEEDRNVLLNQNSAGQVVIG
jgi:spermine oxidase